MNNNNFKVEYIFIIIIFSTLIQQINTKTIFSIVFSALLLFLFNNVLNLNLNLKLKLNLTEMLERKNLKEYTYLNSNDAVINFLLKYEDYYDLNNETFKSLIKLLNNMLKLKSEINSSRNYHMDHDVMLSLKPKILNTYHSFIYNLPHTEANLDKFHTGAKQLLLVVNAILDDINGEILNRAKKEPISVSTKFHYRSHPKAANQSNLNSTYHV